MIGRALADRIIRAGKEGHRFRVVVLIPEVPGEMVVRQLEDVSRDSNELLVGFAGDISSVGDLKTIMAAQWRSINRGGKSIFVSLWSIKLKQLRMSDQPKGRS